MRRRIHDTAGYPGTRRGWVSGWLLLLACSAAAAQVTDEAVQLRYRFQPGQEYRYRMTVTGDMGMTLPGFGGPGGGNMIGKVPINMNGTYEWVQKVKSVSPEGVATVSLGLDKMELTSGVMGMNMTMRLGAGGKMETLMNGQPMAVPNAPTATIPNPLYEATIDPTGKVTVLGGEAANSMSQLFGGQNLSAMFNGNMPGMGMLLLPARPIKPGESWETKASVKIPIPTPGPGGPGPGAPGAGGLLPVSYTVQNKLARVENGRAVIETRLTASVPGGSKMPLPARGGMPAGMSLSMEKMDQSMTGTQQFSVEQGVMEGGDFVMTMAMTMALGLPAGMAGSGAPAPGGKPAAKTGSARPRAGGTKAGAAGKPQAAANPAPMHMNMDGTAKIKIDRLTAPKEAAAP